MPNKEAYSAEKGGIWCHMFPRDNTVLKKEHMVRKKEAYIGVFSLG